jgi:chromosome segregation ATPase
LALAKDAEFVVVKESLVDDHQASLAKFHALIETERQETAARHAKELESHKSQASTVTAELTEKLAAAETRLQEVIESHKASMETITAEKDALIAAIKARQEDTEAKHEKELADLNAALEKATLAMMVHLLMTSLTSRKRYKQRMRQRKYMKRNWRCVSRDLNLQKV